MWISVKPVTSRWREHVLDELLRGDRVRVLLLPRRRECAELALHAADVRLVDVEVLDEVDLVRSAAHAAREIGERAELEEVVGLEDRHAVVEVEALAGLDLLPDRLQRLGRERRSASPLHDGPRQRLELVPRGAVEAGPGLRSVVEGQLAGPVERTGRRDADEDAFLRPAGERLAYDGILLAARRSGSVGVPSRRSVPGTFPVSIVSPAQSSTSSAIWNAIPSRRPYSRSRRRARTRLEELPRLEGAALQVVVDRRVGIVALAALHRLAAREGERRLGQHDDRGVAGVREHEKARAKR